MWLDQGKTILLNVLVTISLILSWMLLNSQPKYEILHPAEYVEQKTLGEKRELHQLVRPQSIVFHFGDRYTLAVPDSPYYTIIEKEMEKWYFFDLARADLTDEKWQQIQREKKAIEIIYPDGIPIEVMQELFTFRGKADQLIQWVRRIIIYEDDLQKETYALFVNEDGTQTIQARTAITSRDLDHFYLSLGNSQPEHVPYSLSGDDRMPIVYLPKERLRMKEYRYFFQPIPVSQMIQTLFVDPSLTRQINERDGSTIYTDGSKAVQIPSSHRSIHFHDPMAESMSMTTRNSSLNHVIHFVNEHGGWNGNYILESVKELYSQEVTYLFRQYVNFYPVYGARGEMIGSMEVNSEQNVVTGFHRSLIQMDTAFNEQDVEVMAAQDVLDRLSLMGIDLKEVKDIFQGYHAKINDYHLTLAPIWIVKMKGMDPLIIDAKWIEKEGKSDGLEKSENDSHPSVPSAG